MVPELTYLTNFRSFWAPHYYWIRKEALLSKGPSRRYGAIRTEIAPIALYEGATNLAEVTRRFARSEFILRRALSRTRRPTRGV